MPHKLKLCLQDGPASVPAAVEIGQAVIAGWTGRDRAALEHHIVELEKLGVKRPASTPIFYRVSAARLTTAPMIEVSGEESSGEAEFVLLRAGGRLWVGVGSDHTDRQVETYGVTVSKQMCDKPVAPVFWPYEEVAGHWDRLILRSFIRENGADVLYQEGPVATMLAPPDLLALWQPSASLSTALAEGTMMFCGTLAAKGGIRPSARFMFELEDPVLARRIRHSYEVCSLAVVG